MHLNMSHIPQKSPKTFEGFDFGRIRGKGGEALSQLPTLSNLYARRNLALIGPEGVGKTHLAQAYGRECCMRGMQAYYIKARELSEKLAKAVKLGSSANLVNQLVRPACLIDRRDSAGASSTRSAPTCCSTSSTPAARRTARTSSS